MHCTVITFFSDLQQPVVPFEISKIIQLCICAKINTKINESEKLKNLLNANFSLNPTGFLIEFVDLQQKSNIFSSFST